MCVCVCLLLSKNKEGDDDEGCKFVGSQAPDLSQIRILPP